ncbi:MAG: carcinine hydrolase/isopenicillin-N N-acyltransferase family protein [Planctomycetota bacterium]|nr:carcinine hydrolase/isopenicillin-N N-acyltransferase family protein [Planctomycetota bacterium]
MPTRREALQAIAGLAVGGMTLDNTTLLRAAGTSTRVTKLVDLSGDPKTVGSRFGAANAGDIKKHMKAVLGDWRKRGLSDADMIRKSEPFRHFTAKFAPAWAEEDNACAIRAGVRPELYTAFLAGKYRNLFFVDECTSFFALGETTADGAPLFHKNRDNAPREQCAYRKRVRHSSRPAAFHATGDTSDSGLMMMVNEHGLAGSADTGGLKETRPKGRGVMNPYILRLIAERAERCEDALEIIQEMIRDGWYAGGSKTGTNWFFADRYGKGLRVAQNSHEEKHWFFRDTIVFSTRGDTAGAKIVQAKKGKVTLADMNAAATHPSICFGSSISGLTVRIDPKHPAQLNSVWFALPCISPYVPLYPLATGTPKVILDGKSSTAGRGLLSLVLKPGRQKWARGAKLAGELLESHQQTQDAIYARDKLVQDKIEKAFVSGSNDDARQLATQGVLDGCSTLMDYLGSLKTNT